MKTYWIELKLEMLLAICPPSEDISTPPARIGHAGVQRAVAGQLVLHALAKAASAFDVVETHLTVSFVAVAAVDFVDGAPL